MRYERLKITRDTNTVYNRAVPQWEIPILEFVFGEGNVVQLDVFEQAPIDYPEPRHEFERLSKKYGVDKDTGTDFVASVYGNSRIGVRELGKAIDAAKVEDAKAARLARNAVKARRVPEVVDPLLN